MVYVRLNYYDCYDEEHNKKQCFSIDIWRGQNPINWKNSYYPISRHFDKIEQKAVFAQLAKEWFVSGEIDIDTLQMIDFEIAVW